MVLDESRCHTGRQDKVLSLLLQTLPSQIPQLTALQCVTLANLLLCASFAVPTNAYTLPLPSSVTTD